MAFYPYFAVCSRCVLLLCGMAISISAHPVVSNVPDIRRPFASHPSATMSDRVLPARMPQKVNASDLNEGFLPLPTGPVHQLNDHDITWYITDTLTLNIEIGEWRLSESKVMEALEAANAAIGKKVGSSPLDEPFIQKTGGRINTMLFEIRSESTDQSLTWAQVGEVLGANGLPSYFRAYDIWRSTFFDVVDSERGKIGHGALRKWYMVESPRQGNLTMSASGDIIPA